MWKFTGKKLKLRCHVMDPRSHMTSRQSPVHFAVVTPLPPSEKIKRSELSGAGVERDKGKELTFVEKIPS